MPARYSGFETCVEQVGRRMIDRGHDVTVYCRRSRYPDQPREHLGMKLRHLPALPTKHLETLSHTALSAIGLPRDSAVICMGVGNAPVTRCLELAGRRVVFNVDGADWSRLKWGGFASRYLRRCELMAARGRSPIVADAESVRQHYINAYQRESVLIPYGAEAPADSGIETLDEFGLEAGRYILFVGRLVPENGAHDFLAAATRSLPEVRAVVVGGADYAGAYIASLQRDAPSSAVFTGYQFGKAYQQLTANAGLFVLAASVGGTHPVLLEQMAAGNCVLARRTDSNLEVVGDTAITWSTAGELEEALTRAWTDPALRRQLGEAARRRVAEKYSWDAVTTAYLDLCRTTVDPRLVEEAEAPVSTP